LRACTDSAVVAATTAGGGGQGVQGGRGPRFAERSHQDPQRGALHAAALRERTGPWCVWRVHLRVLNRCSDSIRYPLTCPDSICSFPPAQITQRA
jgi:hypothetical protein